MAYACKERWQTSKGTVLERNIHMLNNPVMSDIKFAFPDHNKRIIPAHKYVLATSSPVFFATSYGELRDTKETIEIREFDPNIFFQFLRFLYCDDVAFQNENNVIHLWRVADTYDVPSLAVKCVDFLHGAMKPLNAFDIIHFARNINNERLEKSCWEVIDYNAKEIMDDNSFSELSRELLFEVVKRPSLRIDEVSLFRAVDRWATKRCVDEAKVVDGATKRLPLGEDLVENIRFRAMSPNQFSDVVMTSEFLSKDEEVDIRQQFSFMWRFKCPARPRTKRDVSVVSCALGTEYNPYSNCPLTPSPIEHLVKRGVLTFTVRERISLCGVTIIKKIGVPGCKAEYPVFQASVSVAYRGKNLRTVKNHKFVVEERHITVGYRVAFNVFFNRPLTLCGSARYTIETSTEPLGYQGLFVWSLSRSLLYSLSGKPDSSIENPNRGNNNTIVSGVCSGEYTEGIPDDVHYKGEVLALLFEPPEGKMNPSFQLTKPKLQSKTV